MLIANVQERLLLLQKASAWVEVDGQGLSDAAIIREERLKEDTKEGLQESLPAIQEGPLSNGQSS